MTEIKARRFLRRALSGEHQDLRDRLEGIAVGAELPRDAIYLFNALEPMLAAAERNTEVPVALGACSAVAVRGRRSATGEPIIARNFDYLPLVQPLYTVRENRPAGVAPAAVWTGKAPAPLLGRCVLQSSVVRDRRFADLLSQTDCFGPAELTSDLASR